MNPLRTLPTAPKTSKNRFQAAALLIGAALSLALAGCTLFDRGPDMNSGLVNRSSKQRIFFATYDQVWRAVHTALKYTIASENPDTGLIETEFIKAMDGWVAPGEKRNLSSGERYKLVIVLAKGKTEGRDSTRVTIEKRGELLKDFFSEPKPLESDGLEESVLFYRIERELIISEALKRAAG